MTRTVLLGALLLCGCAAGRRPVVTAHQADTTAADTLPAADTLAADSLAVDSMPVDSAVTTGRLPNGLRYYIRENHRPEKRAELRLVVNAGSVLEDDDQRGLAHFVEHMAFNGTTNFEKRELVDFIERIGMQFGAHVNAYTSFDETVYMLAVPTDTGGYLATGLQVLEDWAHGITFDSTEVVKERGVVIEEWRGGLGARTRLDRQLYPVLLRGSRYPERLPIGTKESLERAQPEALRRFYRDWYRPDLMAVVAVGDFDAADVQRMIEERFGGLSAPDSARPRPRVALPLRDSAATVIATDPEATGTSASIYWFRGEARPQGTVSAYREALVDRLYSGMLDARLDEVSRTPNPPFLRASGGVSHVVREAEAFAVGAVVPDSGVARGLEAVLTEVERVQRYGFTEAELARTKQNYLRGFERAYAEREKAESRGFADRYVAHFLSGVPIPGAADQLALARRLFGGITLEDVDGAASAWLALQDRVLAVSAPKKPGLALPPGDSLLALVPRVQQAELQRYQDTVSDAPLVAAGLPDRPIATESRDTVLGTTTWTLPNGVRVILKPTDFRADEVYVAAYSPGGLSLMPDSLLTSGEFAAQVAANGGLGEHSVVELRKKLSGIVAQVGVGIGPYDESLSGGASLQDMRSLFELIYLRFTAPRADSAAFEALRSKLRAQLANVSASPEAALEDTLQAILAQHHPRVRRPTVAHVDSLDIGEAMAVYRDRFADADDFTFVFVGSFALDSIRPLVGRYLGNLPVKPGPEKPRDLGIRPPDEPVVRTVRKGIDQTSQTRLVFIGPMAFEPEERFALSILGEALKLKLRDRLREDLGGTYGVDVRTSTAGVPVPEYIVSIRFGSDPARVEELVRATLAELDTVRRVGIAASYLAKIKETTLREREVLLKENRYWLATLIGAVQNGEDLRQVLEVPRLLSRVSSESVRRSAEKYLDVKRLVRVTLLPEKAAAAQP